MNACPGLAEWEAFSQDVCVPSQSREFAAHLDDCAACRAVLEQVRGNDAWLLEIRSLWSGSRNPAADPSVPVGKRIGSYQITGLLGSGGMATVYSARQDNPQRTVALKVLRPGLASPAALRRLQHEAELLGRLQHPGIGRIYEAGYADLDGVRQPFFAMELVEGQRLTEFAERRKLSTRERLELMARIGEAVQFAHQKGVIHRDLKPSNILVVDEQADTNGKRNNGDSQAAEAGSRGSSSTVGAQPKILDFGVACCTDSDVQVTTLHTALGQLVGTIPYMSPEQAAGNPTEIDVRSDVYALGLISYELLTGRLPYDVRDKGVAAAIHVIREEEPTPLSHANRTLRGDIQTIVAKALEKDKTRRYSSASALVADIRRFLNDEPISARPPSATYQLTKFAKRNKALVTGVAGVFLALLTGLVATGVGLMRTTTERNRALDAEKLAQTRRAEAETVIGLLTDMLGSANPQEVKGADYTVRQLLDDSAKGLEGRFPGQPEVEATIRAAIGNAYRGLGLRPQGEVHLKEALELRRTALGREHLDVARSLYDYAWWLEDDAQHAEAERTFHAALRIQRKLLGPQHLTVAQTLNGLAEALRQGSQCAAAEPLAREALAIRRLQLSPNQPEIAESLDILGRILRDACRYAEAEASLREALAIWRAAHGEHHPAIARGLNALGITLQRSGNRPMAEAAYQEALSVARNVLDPRHHDIAVILGEYAWLLAQNDRYAEALALFEEAIAIQRLAHGDVHLCVACNLQRLCALRTWEGDYAAAESACRESLTIHEQLEPEPRPLTQLDRENLALVLIPLGRTAEAKELAHDALAHHQAQHGDRHFRTAVAKRILGAAVSQAGDPVAGEAFLRDAVETLRGLPGCEGWARAAAESDLGECLVAQGRFQEAELLLTEAYDVLQESRGTRFVETQNALRRLVSAHEQSGQSELAEHYRALLMTALSSAAHVEMTVGNP